jgi:hypothetical protein
MKVGSGYGDTIQGHVYLRNASFLETIPPAANNNSNTNPNPTNNSNDATSTTASTNTTSPLPTHSSSAKESTDAKHRKWLIYLRNKLFLYCGETVQKTTENNIAAPNGINTNNNNNNNNTTADPVITNATAKSDNAPYGYILHSISTLTLREDVSAKLILSSTNINNHDAIVGDGRFLYVLKAKGQLEVFDPLGSFNADGHLEPVSSLTLAAPPPTTPPPPPPPGAPAPAGGRGGGGGGGWLPPPFPHLPLLLRLLSRPSF